MTNTDSTETGYSGPGTLGEIIEEDGEKHFILDYDNQQDKSPGEWEEIIETYEDILIDIYEVVQTYDGPDRAWHIGRLIAEHNVEDSDSDIAFTLLDEYSSGDIMYGRRFLCARGMYKVWPDQGYNPDGAITSMGEFAWAAVQQDRVEEARKGYMNFRDYGERLRRQDGRIWKNIEGGTINEMAQVASEKHSNPIEYNVSHAVKRQLLLANQNVSEVNPEKVKSAVKEHAEIP